MAVLGALGLPVGGVADVPEALRAVRSQPGRTVWSRSSSTGWADAPIGAPGAAGRDRARPGWRDARARGRHRPPPTAVTDGWSPTARAEVDGRTLDSYELPLDAGGSARSSRATTGSPWRARRRWPLRLSSSPPRALCPRRRGGRSFRCTPCGPTRTGVSGATPTWRPGPVGAARCGGALVGTLPLYPVFLEEPADPSPYLP